MRCLKLSCAILNLLLGGWKGFPLVLGEAGGWWALMIEPVVQVAVIPLGEITAEAPPAKGDTVTGIAPSSTDDPESRFFADPLEEVLQQQWIIWVLFFHN